MRTQSNSTWERTVPLARQKPGEFPEEAQRICVEVATVVAAVTVEGVLAAASCLVEVLGGLGKQGSCGDCSATSRR